MKNLNHFTLKELMHKTLMLLQSDVSSGGGYFSFLLLLASC